MSYGTPEWKPWVLGEEEGIAQIKFACVFLQIQGPEKNTASPGVPPSQARDSIFIFIFIFIC